MEKQTFAQEVLAAESTLYHVAKTILHQEAQCEDAVQEGILKAYEKLHTLKDETYFKTWLVRIVINECYSMARRTRPSVPYEEYAADQIQEQEDYTQLYAAIRELHPRIRITVVLYYIEGYSIKEIADILRVPSGTVKSRLAKGRRLMRNYLESEDEAWII